MLCQYHNKITSTGAFPAETDPKKIKYKFGITENNGLAS